MSSRCVVVGADGVVGGILSRALGAVPVVHREKPEPGEVHLRDAAKLIADAEVVVNTQGFRPRPGMSDAQCDASHGPPTAALVKAMSPGALLIHISSASVQGWAERAIPASWPPAPEQFPMPAYAISKWRAERIAIEHGAARGIKTAALLPAIVYQFPPDGMLQSMVRLAKNSGILLRLLPGATRHHFCSAELLGRVAQAIVAKRGSLAHGERFLAADPFVVSNRQLEEELILPVLRGRHRLTIPIHPRAMWKTYRRLGDFGLPASRFDLSSGVLGVMGFDVVYDPLPTLERLGLSASDFSRERTWRPFVNAVTES